MPRVRFLGRPRLGDLRAHVRWLARRPRAYLPVVWTVARGALRTSPAHALKEAVVLARAAALADAVAHEGVAHVHAHFANHPATAAWIVHRLTGIPFSFTAHANDLFLGPALLERKTADAAFAIAISDYNRALLLDRCPGARVEVVHCGVDLERHPWRGLADRDPNRIVCVASLLPKKGHAHLVDAVALLADRHPDVVLELVGDGPERERILARARERGVAERVRLLGARSWEGVRDALAQARVVALPSVRLPSGRMEGIPVALMEAMAIGVPVVHSDAPALVEVAGGTGTVARRKDPVALATALRTVLADPVRTTSLVVAAKQRAARFTWEHAATSLWALHVELHRSTRAAPA
jgi:glycosyltransferase involved in cell wall biosynthesis